jgi:hypothetical protein
MNVMDVPGIFALGFFMYSLNVSSSQVMPEFLLADVYLNPSIAPADRPASPFSLGPTSFLAASPVDSDQVRAVGRSLRRLVSLRRRPTNLSIVAIVTDPSVARAISSISASTPANTEPSSVCASISD